MNLSPWGIFQTTVCCEVFGCVLRRRTWWMTGCKIGSTQQSHLHFQVTNVLVLGSPAFSGHRSSFTHAESGRGFEEHVHCRQSNVGLFTRASNGIRSIISTSIDRSEESSGTHCAIMGATRKRHWKGSCDNWINPRTCSSSSYVITIILAIDAVERAASSSLHAQRTRIWIQRNYCRGPKGSPSHPRLNGFTSHI